LLKLYLADKKLSAFAVIAVNFTIMKKTFALIMLVAFVAVLASSCASRRGCPTTNPRYFRA
jgi:hypothetical protein